MFKTLAQLATIGERTSLMASVVEAQAEQNRREKAERVQKAKEAAHHAGLYQESVKLLAYWELGHLTDQQYQDAVNEAFNRGKAPCPGT